MNEPAHWSAVEAARQIRAGGISSSEYLELLLSNIHLTDDRVQAWARIAESGARAEAARCDEAAARGDWRGPLHGVPVAIKDNFDTAGLATEAGSAMMANRIPSKDAEAVTRLRSAGAIVLGKTAMTAFAAMESGPDAKSLEYGSHAGRIEQRLRGGGGGAHVQRRDRYTNRGIDPAAGGLLRRVWIEADIRSGFARRRHRLCVVDGSRGSDRDRCWRSGLDVRRALRPRWGRWGAHRQTGRGRSRPLL